MEDQVSIGTNLQTPGAYSPTPKKRKWKRFILFIAFLLLLLGAGYVGASTFFGGSSDEEANAEITPTETPFPTEEPFETPTPQVSPTPEVTSTPSPKPTANPIDKTSGLDRSKLSVQVQNGSGQVGVASKASGFLKSVGYRVSATGNAANFEYENVTISIKSDFSKYLSLLKSDLSSQYTVGSTSATLSASSSADAIVIIGK